MSSIILNNTAKDNILINKYDIKNFIPERIDYMPRVESKNSKCIEEVAGNDLRLLKYYPAGHDFCLNIIDKARKAEKCSNVEIIKDYSEDYYSIYVKKETFSEYFGWCKNHTIRQNLIEQLKRDLIRGIIYIKGEDKRGKYLDKTAPFKINKIRLYEDTEYYAQVLLHKGIYKGLIEGTCFKNGGEGYIRIPQFLFPICTRYEKGELQSYNPAYKLQILGLSRNSGKKKLIEIKQEEFLKYVIPEYLDKDGYLKDITIQRLQSSLGNQSRGISAEIENTMLVKSFYYGQRGDDTTLYFSNYGK